MDAAGGLDISCHKVQRCVGTSASTANASTSFKFVLPGLPDELALQCLARVSVLGPLRRVCKRWKEVIETSEEFLSIQAEVGTKPVDWLYVMVRDRGGSYSWHAFDPMTSTWHALPAMPEAVDFQLTSAGSIGLTHRVQCVSTGKKLVMLAGLKLSTKDKVLHQWSPLEPALEHPWVFDPRNCLWKKGRPFKIPRRWCVCGVVDDKVYVASGCGLLWNISISKSTDIYDPEADTWETLPLTLQSSKFSGEAIPAVNVDGKLHMVSGRGVFMKVGAVFCSSTRQWSKMPEGLRVGWNGSCVSVYGRFFVVDAWNGKLSVYDTREDRWHTIFEDPRLKGMVNLTAGKRIICGMVEPFHRGPLPDDRSCLRIIDLNSLPPTIVELAVPQGRVVCTQVLARMSLIKR